MDAQLELDVLVVGARPVGLLGAVATAVNDAAVHLDPGAQLFPGHSTDTPHPVPTPA